MKSLARLAAAIGDVIGARELTMLVGLGLVGYGAGAIYFPAGFFLPGAVLLYVAIAGLR